MFWGRPCWSGAVRSHPGPSTSTSARPPSRWKSSKRGRRRAAPGTIASLCGAAFLGDLYQATLAWWFGLAVGFEALFLVEGKWEMPQTTKKQKQSKPRIGGNFLEGIVANGFRSDATHIVVPCASDWDPLVGTRLTSLEFSAVVMFQGYLF